MDIHATPTKALRAPHQASSTPPAFNGGTRQPAPKSTARRKNNKSLNHQQPAQQPPAWEGANASDPNDGYFDANGHFVSSHQGSPAPPKGKKHQQKKSKNVSIEPPVMQHNAHTGQPFAIQGTPAKAAYAGPTFHASPAASALPVPSFLSKSGPAATNSTSLQARLSQDIDSSEGSAASTPVVADIKPAAVAPPRQESPLEFFFKADREEKAKQGGSNTPTTPNARREPPVSQSAPPGNNWSNIYGGAERHHQRTESSGSQRGMFPLELDGASAQQSLSPVHSASNARVASPQTQPRQAQDDPLRKFLYDTANAGSPSPKMPRTEQPRVSGYSSDQQNASPFQRPPLLQRSTSGPNTPVPHPNQHAAAQQNNALHYGNRNLSPLFHAAKNDPSKRSNLRREVSASPTSPTGSRVELPAGGASPHHWAPIYQQPQPVHYLTPSPHPGVASSAPPAAARSNSYGGQPSTTAAPPHDTKTMEDDLRRILRLTASSGGV